MYREKKKKHRNKANTGKHEQWSQQSSSVTTETFIFPNITPRENFTEEYEEWV